MNNNKTQQIDIQTLSKHRLHVVCSTVCLSIAAGIWVSLVLSSYDIFESDYFLPHQMGMGLLSIWNVVACILLMVAMRTRGPLIFLGGFAALFFGWLIGVVLIVVSSIKIINARKLVSQ
jgi:hypothetical protein